MLKKLKNIGITLATLGLLGIPTLAPAAIASADTTTDIQNHICGGSDLKITDSGDCSTTSAAGDSLNTLITNIVNILSLIVGIVAVIMIIIGGLRYITSGGESSNVSGAKNTIIFAIVGLIIVALAQIIVHFVLSKSTSLGS